MVFRRIVCLVALAFLCVACSTPIPGSVPVEETAEASSSPALTNADQVATALAWTPQVTPMPSVLIDWSHIQTGLVTIWRTPVSNPGSEIEVEAITTNLGCGDGCQVGLLAYHENPGDRIEGYTKIVWGDKIYREDVMTWPYWRVFAYRQNGIVVVYSVSDWIHFS